ncbi:MAG: FAD-dependent oxidoreductase [Nocardioidaceae bacterium]
MTSHTDIAVVGAGIVGLATAYAAKQRGLSVTVYDAAPPGRPMTTRGWSPWLSMAATCGARGRASSAPSWSPTTAPSRWGRRSMTG